MVTEETEQDPDVAALAHDLRASLGKLIRRLREQAGHSDLSHSQASVVRQLENGGPQTATALAASAGMRPQSMAKIVELLQQRLLISGAPDPTDGRKTLFSVTPQASAQFRAGRLAKEDVLATSMQARLDATELRQLAVAIPLLQRLAEPEPPA